MQQRGETGVAEKLCITMGAGERERYNCLIQRGNRFYELKSGSPHLEYRPEQLAAVLANYRRLGVAYRVARQTGWLRHGTRRRELCEWFIPSFHHKRSVPLFGKGG